MSNTQESVVAKHTRTLSRADALAYILSLTAAELDNVGYSGYTTLIDPIYWDDDMANPPMLQGCWKTMYIGRRQHGGYGKLLMLPDHDHPRKVWCKGQVVFAQNQGLTLPQAVRWIESDISNRHRYLDYLVEVLKNPSLIAKYEKYNPHLSEDYASRWSAHNGVLDGFKHTQRLMFIELMREVIGDGSDYVPEEYQPRPAILGEVIPEAGKPWEQ